MRVIVLGGCGAMGSEATRDLALTSDFDEIVIADADLPKAQRLAQDLGGNRVTAIQADASDESGLTEKFRGFDVVANCTTYHYGINVTRAAIRARVNYLDLGGLFNTPRQLELNDEARRADVTICLGCGATPGVSNLMARYAAERLDEVEAVHIAFASFRSIAPSPGLLDTILDEFSPESIRFFWEDGKFVEVPAFAGAKQVRFSDPVGEIETYYVPHSETHTLPRFLGTTLRLVDVRGTWRPSTMRALKVFSEFGLSGTRSTQFGGQEIKPKDFLRKHILDQAGTVGEEGEWAFLLHVEVLGLKDARPAKYTYRTSHPLRSKWNTSATARMTGIPLSVGAQKLARGEAKQTGVVAPEVCFDPTSFFEELSKREILINEVIDV